MNIAFIGPFSSPVTALLPPCTLPAPVEDAFSLVDVSAVMSPAAAAEAPDNPAAIAALDSDEGTHSLHAEGHSVASSFPRSASISALHFMSKILMQREIC